MTDTPSLAGRIALVTGATRGIGRASALALAGAGAHVIAVGRTQGALEELDDEIRALRPDADNPMATGGTNLGPRSKALVQAVRQQITQLKKEGITPTPDLATASGSGVDPDISPADAYAQVNAVAKARGLPAAAVRRLVAEHIQQPQFGFLGSSYINVLQLNEALEAMR